MRRRPLDLGFELTNLCNLHCTHCIRGSHQARIDRLGMPFVARVLDEARALFDPLSVVFTGGEPLASEIFPAAVDELRRRGLPYRFVTNGWLIPRHLPTLLAHPPAFVRISLSGARESTHDAQRGSGSFRRALLGAAALMSRGIRAELSMVITTESRGEIGEAVALATQLGVAEMHFILPPPTPESALAALDLGPAAWDDAAAEVAAHAAANRGGAPLVRLDYGSRMPMPARARCNTLALRQLYVDATGRVPFCCQLSRYGTGDDPVLGDLNAEPLAAVAARAGMLYDGFVEATALRHAAGEWDRADDYPCLSCARHHGKAGFLAAFPEHPWAALAELAASPAAAGAHSA